MKSTAIFLIIMLFSGCAKITSSEDNNKANILNILQDIEIAYNYGDLQAIMDAFHPDFLHNGNDYYAEQIIWEIRLNAYPEMSITGIEISKVNDYDYLAEFTLIFTNDQEEIQSQEPSDENGDLSYFQKDEFGWRLIGNGDE